LVENYPDLAENKLVDLDHFKEFTITRQLLKQRGFTLVEAMVTAAILGGLALVLSQLSKQQSEQTVASAISNDTSMLKTQIQSYLMAPSHCNANFYGVTATASTSPYQPTNGINTCGSTTDSCRGSSAVVQGTIKKFTDDATVNTNWATAPGSKRVRVSGVDLWADRLVIPSGSTAIVSTGYMKVTLQAKLMKATPTYPTGVKVDSLLFKTPVVWDGTKVSGCPKSWNSTVPY
jgi:prepilin-type N-terminal cleavage/methylation domain-containing protein